jgi:hypothetical protein
VKKDEELIIKKWFAEAICKNTSRNFWAEVKKIRGNKTA